MCPYVGSNNLWLGVIWHPYVRSSPGTEEQFTSTRFIVRFHHFYWFRWWGARAGSPDRCSAASEANGTEQKHVSGGFPYISVRLPSEFPSHTTRHFHAPHGWHGGGRWPHSTRGTASGGFWEQFQLLSFSNVQKKSFFSAIFRSWAIIWKMLIFTRAPFSMLAMVLLLVIFVLVMLDQLKHSAEMESSHLTIIPLKVRAADLTLTGRGWVMFLTSTCITACSQAITCVTRIPTALNTLLYIR